MYGVACGVGVCHRAMQVVKIGRLEVRWCSSGLLLLYTCPYTACMCPQVAKIGRPGYRVTKQKDPESNQVLFDPS